MRLETFFKNFELLADAPNGVQKLRELILQLAVQGKLVPQDPTDEPASVLLEKIRAEKERLIEKKKIRKDKPLPQIELSELAYNLPTGWNWARLGDIILSIIGGGTPSKNNPQFWGGDIPWASVKDLKASKYLETTIDFVTKIGIQKSSTNLIPKGRVIICTRMGLGKIAINSLDVAINQDLKAIELADGIDINYFYNFYLTQNIVGTGVTVSGIRQSDLLNFIVPIPPLNEQKRIVAKVDQLMALCDELETRQRHRRESCVRLNNAAIAQLFTTREPNDFSKHWQSICDNFDLLYSVPENIGKLRQAILQLAVQGKLVPQDPSDEPASVLLEKIKVEKERLVKEKKIEKLKPLAPIEKDEIIFELPNSWKWVRLGEVSVFGPKNGYSPKPVDYPTNVKSLTLSATTSGEFNGNYFKYINEEIDIDSHLWLEEGDLLIQRGNTPEYVGIAAVYKGLCQEFIYPDLMMKIRFSKYAHIDYLHRAINSNSSRNFFRERATGTSGSMPKINQTTVSNLAIPLPPREEQKRIVAKVDKLMNLCNELEAKLIQSQNNSGKLMDAAVRQILRV